MNHHKNLKAHFFPIIDITFEIFLHGDLVQALQHSFFSALPGNAALRQHAKPLSSDSLPSELPKLYSTSGLDTASLLSSDTQTAFLLRNLFSEVLIHTPLPSHNRLPEYCAADPSRPPTPNFTDYPVRVDGSSIYDPKNDPRFPILTERVITTNDSLSNERKETELKQLQSFN